MLRLNPTIEPIIAWELDTGTKGKAGKCKKVNRLANDFDENINNTNEDEMTTIRPVKGDSLNKSLPTVLIFFWEYVKIPIPIAIAPITKSWVVLEIV